MKQCFIMLDYPSLAALAAVIREGSFERAGQALGITPSAVSQRVRGLEDRLGAVLVKRAQPCEATALGRQLCAHLDRVRLLELELAPALGQSTAAATPAPSVPIAVNADSLASWFHGAAAAFGRDGSAALDLKLDDEAHTAARLRSGEVLAAVSTDPEPVQGCKTVPLGVLRYAACAGPDFIARHFPGTVDASALAAAPYLCFDRRDGLQQRWAQEAYGCALRGTVHWAPSTHAFIDLAVAGLGWAVHPVALVEPHLGRGSLIELPPRLRIGVPLYWTVTRLHTHTLSRLTDAVRAAAAAGLEPPLG